MDARIAKLLEPTPQRQGVSEDELERLHQHIGRHLPMDYVDFLLWSNGVRGSMLPYLPALSGQAARTGIELFSVEEALEFNRGQQIYAQKWCKLLPGHLAIGDVGPYIACINTLSDPKHGFLYAVRDFFEEEDQIPLVYQVDTFADLVEHLSTILLDLSGADLRGADLRGARLFSAIFHNTVLTGADLSGADLREADLWGADLTSAKLANVRLSGALYGHHTCWPAGFDPRQHGAEPWEDV